MIFFLLSLSHSLSRFVGNNWPGIGSGGRGRQREDESKRCTKKVKSALKNVRKPELSQDDFLDNFKGKIQLRSVTTCLLLFRHNFCNVPLPACKSCFLLLAKKEVGTAQKITSAQARSCWNNEKNNTFQKDQSLVRCRSIYFKVSNLGYSFKFMNIVILTILLMKRKSFFSNKKWICPMNFALENLNLLEKKQHVSLPSL